MWAPPELATTLTPVARLRRSQAPARALMAAVFAAAFAWRLDSPWLWSWLAGYAGAQALEIWALWPFRDDAPPPPAWRQAVALAAISALALAFGALAIYLWRVGGPAGPAGAMLLLCGGVLNVLSTSRGCPAAFAAGAAPYIALIAYLPFSWAGLWEQALQPHVMVAALAFAVSVALVWRDGHAATRREQRVLAALEAKRAEAVAANEARRRFVAFVSHELRTPLSAILAASSTLQLRGFCEEERRTAGLVADSARMMRRLLDDLLDLSRLEAGRMSVEAVAFDPRQLVVDTARLWSGPADAKRLTLRTRGLETLPARLSGDPLRLRQVLNNLLSNAVKFTGEGGVEVVCDAREDAGGTHLSVSVLDTGRGLGAGEAAGLFTPFVQSRAADARVEGGAGLGLAISRELARLMGGDLTAGDRGDGPGARFELTVRLGPPPPLPAVADEELALPRSGQDMRVLVIDDHPASRRALRLLMELAGAAVSEAEGGEAGLARLALESFDLVLTDVRMPGLDGHEVVRRLRAGGGPNRGTPVLGVTGLGGGDAAAACRTAGMHGCVVKPVEPAALYAAVEAALTQAETPASVVPASATG